MRSPLGSDAHLLDEQAGTEQPVITLMAAMHGGNLIHDTGYLGQDLLGKPPTIVVRDEIKSYMKRVLRARDVIRETRAIDVIQEVGPGGGFIEVQHLRVIPGVPMAAEVAEARRPRHLERDVVAFRTLTD